MPTTPKKLKTGWSIRACWIDESGEQQQKYRSGFPRLKDARDWAIDYESQNSHAPEGAHKMTAASFLTLWLDTRQASGMFQPNTLRIDRNEVKKILPYIGNIPLQNLRLDHIQNALNLQRGKNGQKLSPRTIEITKITINKALEYAIKLKFIKENPANFLTIPAKAPTPFYILEPEEAISQIKRLKELEHEAYLPVCLAIFLGLRRGEALGLEWANVDFIKKEIKITSQYTIEDGNPIHKTKLKTDGSCDVVAMPEILSDILKQRKSEIDLEGRIEPFVCAIDGKLPTLNNFNLHFKQFQTANGFHVCRFHDLRHTYATWLLQADVQIRTISDMLRHKTKDLALRTYLHPDGSMKQAAACKLDNILKTQNNEKKPATNRRLSV